MEYKKMSLGDQINYWENYLEGLVEFALAMNSEVCIERFSQIIEECWKVYGIIAILRLGEDSPNNKPVLLESNINAKRNWNEYNLGIGQIKRE